MNPHGFEAAIRPKAIVTSAFFDQKSVFQRVPRGSLRFSDGFVCFTELRICVHPPLIFAGEFCLRLSRTCHQNRALSNPL